METLIIDIPEKKSALVKQLLKELGVGMRVAEADEKSTMINHNEDTESFLKVVAESRKNKPELPKEKKTSVDKILAHYGENPDFPSIEEIRAKAWPKRW